MKKSVLTSALCLIFCAGMTVATGCNTDYSAVSFVIANDGEINTNGIVPERETLVENLTNAGYTITEYASVDGSSLSIDRLIAEKEDKFIDITYGLSEEDAEEIFHAYCDIYREDGDHYILALNLNFVYCVSDKETFSTAGFKSTSNIGVQYINK